MVAAPGTTDTNQITIPAQSTLQIYDLVLQNVSGGTGRASLERLPAGTGHTAQPLLVENLQNLTDQEYSFTSPIKLGPGQQLILSVNCGGEQAACDVGVYYTGPFTEPHGDTATPST